VIAVSLGVSYYVSIALFGLAPTILVSPQSVLEVTATLLASIPATLALGYILGSYSIFVSRFEWALPSYVSGLLMIFSEALFPATILPYPLPTIVYALPFTYLIRASRAALIYNQWPYYVSSMAYLIVGGLIFLLIGLSAFSLAERSARERGFIDKKVM
jgi:ABC-type polysaccharide/polyol phosphate export permease